MLRFGKFLVVVVLFTVLVLVSRNASAAWPDSSFERCMNITISNAGSSTLTNFPAYINLTHDEDMLSDFMDIRFYDSPCNQGGSLLDYEIENYTSSDRAHVWVRIPSIPSAGTKISVYYKNNTIVGSGENPTGVWDANYVGVWHMSETDAKDSTQYGYNGTAGFTNITSTADVTATNGTQCVDDDTLEYNNGTYNGWTLRATSGAANGQETTITDYRYFNGSYRVLYFSSQLSGFNEGDNYYIYVPGKEWGPVLNSSGKVKGAIEFDGANDYIDTNFNIPNETGERTVMLWVRIRNKFYSDWARVIVNNALWTGNPATQEGLAINYRSDDIIAYCYNGTGVRTTLTMLDNPQNNTWYHVTLVHDNSDVTSYVNGQLSSSLPCTGSKKNEDGLGIGAYTGLDPHVRFFKGTVDELRVSNSTRSADWINQTYQMVANQANVVSFGSEESIPSTSIDDCSVLDSAGETYLLTQDILDSSNTTCMDIQADNVTLDCQGNWIDGTDGGSSYGVRINNYDNATVRNCDISDWAYGIGLSTSTENEIYNNFITSVTGSGINVASSSNYNNFTNNTVFLNQNYGVYLSSSTNNNFSHGNVSRNTNHSFYLTGADNNRIEYSTIWLNTEDGIRLSSSDGNVIYENNITSNKAGVYMISSSTGNRIEGGNVKSNSNTGIWIFQSTGNNITGVNSSLNTDHGIYLHTSANGNRVENVIVSDNTANGIIIDTASSNIITGFESYSNTDKGVLINYGANNNITGGNIYSNDQGIRLAYTNNNYVIDTLLELSGDYEIYCTDTASSQNYFINSTFDKNDVFVGTNTIIWVRWYLQIEARDVSETPLEDANVSIKDTYGYSWFTGQTNSSGYIPRQILNEYNQTSGGKTFYTNYAINVSKSSYVSNQTSENLTVSKVKIIYLQPIGPPVVKVKTYTRALVERSVFKPNRMVRTRATVTSSEGRDHVSNATIVIKDHLEVTKVNNENMTKISEVANGYVYEYNYTLPGDAQGLWLINVTSIDTENRKGYDFKKIAITILNIQVKLLLNDTWDSARVYIPGEGEKTFAQLGLISPYSDSNPPHYYLASYLNNVLASLVLSPDNPLSISASTGSGNYELETNQKFSNSMVFLVFSRGSWRQVNNRMGMIEKGEFLSHISPTFSYGLGNKYPLKIMLSYDNIDINDTLSVGRGYGRISIENKGVVGSKVNLGIERV